MPTVEMRGSEEAQWIVTNTIHVSPTVALARIYEAEVYQIPIQRIMLIMLS